MGQTEQEIAEWDRITALFQSAPFKAALAEATKNAVEHTLVRLGFRIADVNEVQEDMLFLRRLRKGDPIQRLDRMEIQMAEHERKDEQRQKEILQKLEEADEGRELVHKRISDLKSTINRALVLALLMTLGMLGTLIIKYVLP